MSDEQVAEEAQAVDLFDSSTTTEAESQPEDTEVDLSSRRVFEIDHMLDIARHCKAKDSSIEALIIKAFDKGYLTLTDCDVRGSQEEWSNPTADLLKKHTERTFSSADGSEVDIPEKYCTVIDHKTGRICLAYYGDFVSGTYTSIITKIRNTKTDMQEKRGKIKNACGQIAQVMMWTPENDLEKFLEKHG